MLRLRAEGRYSKVAARWRSARVPVLLLMGAGLLFAAASPNFTRSYSSDVRLYEHYATAALASPVFHALPREYPALALGVFVAPLALPLTYSLRFALLAAAAGLTLVLSSDGTPLSGMVTADLLLPAHGDRRSCVCPLRRFPGPGRRAGSGRGAGRKVGSGPRPGLWPVGCSNCSRSFCYQGS